MTSSVGAPHPPRRKAEDEVFQPWVRMGKGNAGNLMGLQWK